MESKTILNWIVGEYRRDSKSASVDFQCAKNCCLPCTNVVNEEILEGKIRPAENTVCYKCKTLKTPYHDFCKGCFEGVCSKCGEATEIVSDIDSCANFSTLCQPVVSALNRLRGGRKYLKDIDEQYYQLLEKKKHPMTSGTRRA